MAKYLLGENAARKLRGIFNAAEENLPNANGMHSMERNNAPKAWTVRYSSSESAYVIYLPPWALLDGIKDAFAAARTAGIFTPATCYPGYWYKLDSLTFPAEAATIGGEYSLVADIVYADDPYSARIVQPVFRIVTEPFTPYGFRQIFVARLKYYNGDSLTREVIQVTSGSVQLDLDRSAWGYQGKGYQYASLLFGNPIYKIGGLTRRFGNSDLASLSLQSITLPCIVALKLGETTSATAAQLVSYATFGEITGDQSLEYTIHPLYAFDQYGNITADYRNLVTDVRWEA